MKGHGSRYLVIAFICVTATALLFVGCTSSSYESRLDSDVLGYSPPSIANAEYDETGEKCESGSAMVNTPVGEQAFCVMQGRLGEGVALEIDDLNSTDFADANVFNSTVGSPANDPHLPPVSGATFIDWDDLVINNVTEERLGSVENNRILDTVANDDYTMLRPQAASCLNDGSVVPKEDFTQSYIANSDKYLYMAQERRTNNGNSVYYWLLTQNPPYLDTASPDCGSSTRGQILFDIAPGDVQVIVNFPDSSDPTGGAVLFRKYEGSAMPGLLADDAVFAPGWVINAPAIPNFAMNDTESPNEGDDGLPHWGGLDKRGNVIPQDTNEYDAASFAEWAIDLSEIFGIGEPLCGKHLFYTGLSRASTGKIGDPTESSALKDLVGPKLYSFGEITAIANVTGSCDLTFDYSVTAYGLDGVTPIPPGNLTCTWSCTADTAALTYNANACSGTGTLDVPDTVSCTVTVNDSDSGCDDGDGGDDEVLDAINVTIAPDYTSLGCTVPTFPGIDNGTIGSVTFTPSVIGGDGNYTYSWIVNGPSDAACQTGSSTSTCSVHIPDDKYCAYTSVKVWVDDGDPRCPAVASEPEAVTKQTSISASDN